MKKSLIILIILVSAMQGFSQDSIVLNQTAGHLKSLLFYRDSLKNDVVNVTEDISASYRQYRNQFKDSLKFTVICDTISVFLKWDTIVVNDKPFIKKNSKLVYKPDTIHFVLKPSFDEKAYQCWQISSRGRRMKFDFLKTKSYSIGNKTYKVFSFNYLYTNKSKKDFLIIISPEFGCIVIGSASVSNYKAFVNSTPYKTLDILRNDAIKDLKEFVR